MKHIIIVSIALSLCSCKKSYVDQPSTVEKIVNKVTLHELKDESSPIPIAASGLVESDSEITLSFKVGGVVQHVWVSEGQTVRKGQLLARLNLSEVTAQADQARNYFNKTTRDLERIENLHRDSVVTLERLQDAKTAHEVARAQLEIASFNLRYSEIKAPVDGKILSRFIEPGELVGPGQPAMKIGSSGNQGTQVIKIGVADKDIVKIALGDTATLSFDAIPSRRYSALVTEIAEAANPSTGTFSVKLTLTEGFYPELKNGFVAGVHVFPSQTDAYYKIPMTALIEGNKQQAKIFLTQNKKTVFSKTVEVSSIHSDYFTVDKASIKEQPAWVVLQGASYLHEHDTISTLN